MDSEELEKRRAEIGLFVSSGPSSDELKEAVNSKEPREIIYYDGRVYVIRYNEMRNLGLDYKSQIENLCFDRGLPHSVFFGRACLYCSYATTNIKDLVEISDEPFILNQTPKINCVYKSDLNIRVATLFQQQKGRKTPFYAIRAERCAFDDSLISYLADNGHLKNYETDFEFDFLPITDLEPEKPIPYQYLVKEVNKRLPKELTQRKSFLFWLPWRK